MKEVFKFFETHKGEKGSDSIWFELLNKLELRKLNLSDILKQYPNEDKFLLFLFKSNGLVISVDIDLGKFLKKNNKKSIIFKSCIFKEEFLIKNIKLNGNLKFISCIFNSGVFIKGVTFGDMCHSYFKNCEFEKTINIINSKYINHSYFESCKFMQNFKLINNQFKTINFKKNIVNELLELKNCFFEDLLYSNFNEGYGNYLKEAKRIKIHYTDETKFTDLGNININRVQGISELILGTSCSKKNISFNNIVFDRVYGDEGKKGFFLFYNFKVESFSYLNSTYCPRLSISNILFKSMILKYIDLNESIFNESVIESLGISCITFGNSTFNGIVFPKDYKIEELKDINGKIENSKMKDNYRQLKHVMDKNSNYIDANHFYGLEMQYYLKTLNIFSLNYLLYGIQKVISNYGNTWYQPLIWILIFSFLRIIIITNFYQDIYELPESFFTNIINGITPFTNLINNPEISLISFVYNIILISLVYHFAIAIKRTTKR